MTYIDAFVIAVPEASLEAYKAEARGFGALWREHGAVSYMEAVGDDAPMGTLTSFPRAVHLEPGEVVVLGVVTYPDRAARDKVSAALEADPRMRDVMGRMKSIGVSLDRMFFGGFAPIVEA
jgi:uncharacterized protein YbaA (DUF1428 family)